MQRLAFVAAVCLAGCSGRPSLFPAAPSDVSGATIVNRMIEEPAPDPIPLSTSDARAVYSGLKSSEPYKEDENAEVPWATGFEVSFETTSGGTQVSLESGLRLWRPKGAGANINYPIPDGTRVILSGYVEPVPR